MARAHFGIEYAEALAAAVIRVGGRSAVPNHSHADGGDVLGFHCESGKHRAKRDVARGVEIAAAASLFYQATRTTIAVSAGLIVGWSVDLERCSTNCITGLDVGAHETLETHVVFEGHAARTERQGPKQRRAPDQAAPSGTMTQIFRPLWRVNNALFSRCPVA